MSDNPMKSELKSIIEMMELDFYGVSENLKMAKCPELESRFDGQKAVLGQYLRLLKDVLAKETA
jgi:hypothetical protein